MTANLIRGNFSVLGQRGIVVLLLVVLASLVKPCRAMADDGLFIYEDDGETIVYGVTEAGLASIQMEGVLTIPSRVTTVRSTAFAMIPLYGVALRQLIIDGGDPLFELDEDGKNALAAINGSLESITVNGSGLTTEHLATLLTGLDNVGTLTKIDIYDDGFPLDAVFDAADIQTNTSGVRVVLPAARVGTQVFGLAAVYGRFSFNGLSLISFCGWQYFQDIDNGSNCLFYVPTTVQEDEEDGEKKLFIQRVDYVRPGEGVLLHPAEGSSDYVELPRVGEDDVVAGSDDGKYASNMLRGVTVPTRIGATEEIGGVEYANMILYDGLFYPTSDGMLGANRAYLQVRQDDLEGLSKLAMALLETETEGGETETEGGERSEEGGERCEDGILAPRTSHLASRPLADGAWYSMGGQRLNGRPHRQGVYVRRGVKMVPVKR